MIKALLLSLAFSGLANQPQEFTLEDLLNYKCENGNQQACEKLKRIQGQKQDVALMEQRMTDFREQLEQRNLMLDDRRPDLQAAYPLVMIDYFEGLKLAGKEVELVSEDELASCASHYHNHWLHKKLWWPNTDGKPDWESIYVFIVDHYYGFCLKTL